MGSSAAPLRRQRPRLAESRASRSPPPRCLQRRLRTCGKPTQQPLIPAVMQRLSDGLGSQEQKRASRSDVWRSSGGAVAEGASRSVREGRRPTGK